MYFVTISEPKPKGKNEKRMLNLTISSGFPIDLAVRTSGDTPEPVESARAEKSSDNTIK